MVNGKPQLTFGGVGSAGPATTRQRAVTRGGESFASYLPAGKDGIQTGQTGSPLVPAMAQGQRAGGPVGQTAGQPVGQPAGVAPPNARMFLGYLPDNYISPRHSSLSQGQAVQSPPPGARNLAQAQPQALPDSRAMLNNFSAMGSNQNLIANQRFAATQNLAARTAPQLSGAPITGRGNIGMVDNRRSAFQAAPRQQTVASVTVAPGAVSPPGSDPYSSFTAYYGRAAPGLNSQSFVTHGFASKNAEQVMKKMGIDMKSPPSLQTYARRLEPDPYALKASQTADAGATFGSTRPVSFPSGEEGARTAILTASHKRKTDANPASLAPSFRAMADQGLGRLAAKFESGEEGIAAIGYDRKGGTSYGKYQIASRVGTMRGFIDYLGEKAPDLAKRLAAAGPANTGGRSGRMPSEWRKIAAEDPERFENLQSDFIRTSHFEPAKQAIAAATGVTFDQMPQALQEVLFSTAVQHGPAGATRIVSQALQRTGPDKLRNGQSLEKKAEQQLITHIYNLRAGQFVSSTSRVQAAVRQRLKQEMHEALQMLT